MSEDNEMRPTSSNLSRGTSEGILEEISETDFSVAKMTPSQTDTFNVSVGDIAKPDPIVFSRSAETMDTGLEHKLGSQRPDRLHARRSSVIRRNAGVEQHPSSSRTVPGKGIHTVTKAGKIRVSKSCTTECEILRPDHTTVYAYPGITGYSSLYEEILKNDDFSIFPGIESEDIDESVDDVPISNSTALEVDNDDSDLKSEVSDNSGGRISPSSRSVKSEIRSASSRENVMIIRDKPSMNVKRHKKECGSVVTEGSVASDDTEASGRANDELETPFTTSNKVNAHTKDFKSRDVSCNMWSGVKKAVTETSSESSEVCSPFYNGNDSFTSGQSPSFLSDDDTVSEAAGVSNSTKTWVSKERCQTAKNIDDKSLRHLDKPAEKHNKSLGSVHSTPGEDKSLRDLTLPVALDLNCDRYLNIATPPNSFSDVTSQTVVNSTASQDIVPGQGKCGKIKMVQQAPSPTEIKDALHRHAKIRKAEIEGMPGLAEAREESIQNTVNGDITVLFSLPGQSAKQTDDSRPVDRKSEIKTDHMRINSPVISILSLSDMNKFAKNCRSPRREHNDVYYGDRRIDGCEINVNASRSSSQSSVNAGIYTETMLHTNRLDNSFTCQSGHPSAIQPVTQKIQLKTESSKEIVAERNDKLLAPVDGLAKDTDSKCANVGCSKAEDQCMSTTKEETDCSGSVSRDRCDKRHSEADGKALNQVSPKKQHIIAQSGKALNQVSPKKQHTVAQSGKALNQVSPEKQNTVVQSGDGVKACTSGESIEAVKIKAPPPNVPAEYLSFLNVLRNKKLVKKEVRRPKVTKNRRYNAAIRAIQSEFEDGMNTSEEYENSQDDKKFPKGREVPPNWTPGKQKSDTLQAVGKSGRGKLSRGAGKKKGRRMRKTQLSYEKLYNGVTSGNQTPYTHYLSTSRSGSTITITPDPSGYSLRGCSRPLLSSSDDEKNIEALDYDLCGQDFEFKRMYYERIGRMAKKDNSGDATCDISPKQKRITSQVNLLKTIDDYCNAEDYSEKELDLVASEKTYFESDAHVSLAKYYADRQARLPSAAAFARHEPLTSSPCVRIPRVSHHVPSALDNDRLKSIGDKTVQSQAMWDHNVLYPCRPNIMQDSSTSPKRSLYQRRTHRSSSRKGLKKTNVKSNAKLVKKPDNNKCKSLTTATSKRLDESDPMNEGDTTQNKAITGTTGKKSDLTLESTEMQMAREPSCSDQKSLTYETDGPNYKNSPRRPQYGSLQKEKDSAKPRMKVRFADERPGVEKSPFPCDRSEEDTWCYTVNAMLLRANKVLQESELPMKSDHRFPRPESAKVVAPVVHKEPKSSSFLSELLRQDKIERMQAVKQEMAEIREREKLRKTQEKEQEKWQSSDENNSKYGFSAGSGSPTQKKLDGHKNQSCSNKLQLTLPTFEEHRQTAETFRIRAVLSQRAKERALRVCKNMACSSSSPPPHYSPPPPAQPYPKKLLPLRIARPLDFQNPDKRILDHVHMSSYGGSQTPDSSKPTPGVIHQQRSKDDSAYLSKTTNYLLDQHSETLQYYMYPHMNQRPSAIVQLYGSADKNENHMVDVNEHYYAGRGSQRDNLIFTCTCCTCSNFEKSDWKTLDKRAYESPSKHDSNSVPWFCSLPKSDFMKEAHEKRLSKDVSLSMYQRCTANKTMMYEEQDKDYLQTEKNYVGHEKVIKKYRAPISASSKSSLERSLVNFHIMNDHHLRNLNSNAIPKDSDGKKKNDQKANLYDELVFANERTESSGQGSCQWSSPSAQFGKNIQHDSRSGKSALQGHGSGKCSSAALFQKRFTAQHDERLDTISSVSDVNLELSLGEQSSSRIITIAETPTGCKNEGPKLQYGAHDDPDAICIENVMDVFDKACKLENCRITSEEVIVEKSSKADDFKTVDEPLPRIKGHLEDVGKRPNLSAKREQIKRTSPNSDKDKSKKAIGQRDLVHAILTHPTNPRLKHKEENVSPDGELRSLKELMLQQEPECLMETFGDSRSVPFIINYKDQWVPDYYTLEELEFAVAAADQPEEQVEPATVNTPSKTEDCLAVVSDNVGGDADTEKTSVCSGDHLDNSEDKKFFGCPHAAQPFIRPYLVGKIRPLPSEVFAFRQKNQRRSDFGQGVLFGRDEFFVRGYPVRLAEKRPSVPSVLSQPREWPQRISVTPREFSDADDRRYNSPPTWQRENTAGGDESYRLQGECEGSSKSVNSTYDNVPTITQQDIWDENDKDPPVSEWNEENASPSFQVDNGDQDGYFDELSAAWADALKHASRQSAYSSSSSSSVAIKEAAGSQTQNAGDGIQGTLQSGTAETAGQGDAGLRSTSEQKDGNTVSQISDEFADEVGTDAMGDSTRSGLLKGSLESYRACYFNDPKSLLTEEALKRQSEGFGLQKDGLQKFLDAPSHYKNQRKTRVIPENKHPDNNAFPSRDFLKTLRGSDLLKTLIQDRGRLLFCLENLTRHRCFIPVFQVKSLNSEEMMPLVLHVNCCATYDKDKYHQTFSRPLQTMPVFYSEESGLLHSVYTVQHIAEGLYSLEDTDTLYKNDCPENLDLGDFREIKSGRLVQYAPDVAHLAFEKSRTFLIGDEVSSRDQALDLLVRTCDEARGKGISMFYELTIGWVPQGVHQDTIEFLPPVTKVAAADCKVWCPACRSPTEEYTCIKEAALRDMTMNSSMIQSINMWNGSPSFDNANKTVLCLRCGVTMKPSPLPSRNKMKTLKTSTSCRSGWVVSEAGHALPFITKPGHRDNIHFPSLVSRKLGQAQGTEDANRIRSSAQSLTTLPKINYLKSQEGKFTTPLDKSQSLPHIRQKDWWWQPRKRRSKIRRQQKQSCQIIPGSQTSEETAKLSQFNKDFNTMKINKSVRFSQGNKIGKPKRQIGEEPGFTLGRRSWSTPVIPPPFPKSLKEPRSLHSTKSAFLGHNIKRFSRTYVSPYWTKKEVRPFTKAHRSSSAEESSSSSSASSSSSSEEEESSSDESETDTDLSTGQKSDRPKSIDEIFQKISSNFKSSKSLKQNSLREKVEWRHGGFRLGEEYRKLKPFSSGDDQRNPEREHSEHSEYDMCSDAEDAKRLWRLCYPRVDFYSKHQRYKKRKSARDKLWP